MWVLFDLNGTLTDPAALIHPPELPVAALDEANVMVMINAITGRGGDFKPLLEASLRRGLERAGRDPDLAAGAMERVPHMPAYPDVPEALALLRAAGFQLGVLTQSSLAAAEKIVANARLDVDLVLSAPDSGAYKPDARAYRYGLAQAGVEDAWFVAGHWWDIAGAAAAGLRTAWVSRTDLAYPDAMPQPDVRGTTVADVARAIARI